MSTQNSILTHSHKKLSEKTFSKSCFSYKNVIEEDYGVEEFNIEKKRLLAKIDTNESMDSFFSSQNDGENNKFIDSELESKKKPKYQIERLKFNPVTQKYETEGNLKQNNISEEYKSTPIIRPCVQKTLNQKIETFADMVNQDHGYNEEFYDSSTGSDSSKSELNEGVAIAEELSNGSSSDYSSSLSMEEHYVELAYEYLLDQFSLFSQAPQNPNEVPNHKLHKSKLPRSKSSTTLLFNRKSTLTRQNSQQF